MAFLSFGTKLGVIRQSETCDFVPEKRIFGCDRRQVVSGQGPSVACVCRDVGGRKVWWSVVVKTATLYVLFRMRLLYTTRAGETNPPRFQTFLDSRFPFNPYFQNYRHPTAGSSLCTAVSRRTYVCPTHNTGSIINCEL